MTRAAGVLKKRFGQNVRRYREAAGLTQENFYELVGLDRGYMSGVERGVRNITIENVEKIAEGLGIEAARLFEETIHSHSSESGSRGHRVVATGRPSRPRGQLQ